ncbi:NADP-dependent oxidoreductase [Sorangium cellulosum]|uniref:NADP-dependent oxidoreductase n=1 Tax=Sorangium cellulosum TaxID=56 RepID=A0A150R5I6_SORCE|nr:NADP-dependent oxidoreductase [Sorangium cellulosum]KYF92421.1 NADP-dependent oxidoreductase [Sorangium cellulosum]
MIQGVNRQWRLAVRPIGPIDQGLFRWIEEPIPAPATGGQILVRNLYLSIDPTQREWMVHDTYLPAIRIGDVMRSLAVGRVESSTHPSYARGDLVQGLFGWQDYALVDATIPGAATRLPPGMPITRALSTLGLTGLTAYFGLLDVGRVAAGETVVVSGAAGATGSVAGQIARIKQCRVIGIAGGAEKCAWLTREAGFTAAIDYKSEDVRARLRELCPNGVDVYFDNVGGRILDAALAELALRGRVVLCGAISSYGVTELPPGPKNYMNLILKRGRMEGFIIIDYVQRFGAAVQELSGWIAAGQIKDQVDVQGGLENAPQALRRLFSGENRGKQLVKIADS